MDGLLTGDAGRSSHDAAPDGKHDSRVDARGDAAQDVAHTFDAPMNVDGPAEASEAGEASQVDGGSCGAGPGCPDGTTCCSGSCCDSTQACDQGECVATTCAGEVTNHEPCLLSAGVHGTCCGGLCKQVDIATDPNNCGGCGFICPTGGAICGVSGQGPPGQPVCTSPSGALVGCEPAAGCPAGDVCGPSGFYCLAPSCGAGSDGNACALSAPSSSGPGQSGTCCGQVCLDGSHDDNNCGGCGTVCQTGTFCSGNTCLPTPSCGTAPPGTSCPASLGDVGSCCEKSCVNLSQDSQNCGGCERVCPVGTSCGPAGCTTSDGGTASCDAPGGCPPGYSCFGAICLVEVCGAADEGSECAFGNGAQGTCCNSACINIMTNPDHCGWACGVACSSGLCADGKCLPAVGDGGAGCPNGCPQGETCAAGACVLSVCAGFQFENFLCAATDGNAGLCCPVFGGTNCTDLATDPLNCGGCKVACPTGQTCSNGVCSGTKPPCGPGTVGGYCDLDAGTSFLCCAGTGCIDVSSDINNCGVCGKACSSGLTCVSGECVATACSPGTEGENCLLNGLFGASYLCCQSACVDTSTDSSHCGDCGTLCSGVETCGGSVCAVATCSPQTSGEPCHLGSGTGECCPAGCVDTTSDPNNCNGCGLACPTGSTCMNSACH